MLNLSYEYKLKPTAEQAQEIERVLMVCRKVWNYALRERKDWINSLDTPRPIRTGILSSPGAQSLYPQKAS